jgi:membrane-associated protease RseP (regulator of RpoE activity)
MMNARIPDWRWVSFAAAPLVCLLGAPLWAADGAPAAPVEVGLNLRGTRLVCAECHQVPAAPAAEAVIAPKQQADNTIGDPDDVIVFTAEALRLAANADSLGADVAQVGDVLRSHLGLAEAKGLVVSAVADDGPAAKAGIQKNDVLTAIGGEEISDLETFRKALEAAAGKPIVIGLIRAGKKQSVELTPAAPTITDLDISFPVAKPRYWLGVGLASADEALLSQLMLPDGQGLVVINVEEKSPAAAAGVMVNDLLLQLNGTPLATIDALTAQLQEIAGGEASLKLLRRGKPATLTVTPKLHADAASNAFHPHLFLTYSANGTIVGTRAVDSSAVKKQRNVAQQLSDLEAQLKQMEASLAALRAAVVSPLPPAESGAQK